MARRDLGVADPAKLNFCLPTANTVEENNAGKGQGQTWLSPPANQLLIWGLVLMLSWFPSLEAEQHLGLFCLSSFKVSSTDLSLALVIPTQSVHCWE